MSINSVFLSGNLTKDPELRSTQTGKQVCSFTVATNEGKDKVEFHRCVAWEKTAEIVGQYCKKGNRLVVQGRLTTRKWEDSNGVEKYSTEIIAERVDLPPKAKNEEEGGANYNPPAAFVPDSEEIPF